MWTIDIGNEANTEVIDTMDGEYEMPEISNDILDDGEEWEVNARIQKYGKAY